MRSEQSEAPIAASQRGVLARPNVWSRHTLTGAILVAFAFGCSKGPDEPESVSVRSQALTSVFSIVLPEWVYGGQFALATSDALTLGDNAIVLGQLVNTGVNATNVGSNAKTGSVWSVGPANFGNGAVVTGDARSKGTITRGSGVIVTGTATQNASFGTRSRTLTVDFGSGSGGVVSVGAGISRTLAPGSYSGLVVKNTGSLTLTAGQYFFTDFDLQLGSKLVLNGAGGPIQIFAKNILGIRGTMTQPANADSAVMIATLGSATIGLQNGFVGTLLAPNGLVSIGTSNPFKGQVYAKGISVLANTRLDVLPYGGWDTLLDQSPPSPLTNTGASSLAHLLPNNAVGTAIKNYVHAGFSGDDEDQRLAAMTALSNQPADSVASALTNAFRATDDPSIKHALIAVAASWKKAEAIPLFTEVLATSQVPPQPVLNENLERVELAYLRIAFAAEDGLASLVRRGVAAARGPLLDAATKHPIRAVRAQGIVLIVRTGQAAYKTQLDGAIQPADKVFESARPINDSDRATARARIAKLPSGTEPAIAPAGSPGGVVTPGMTPDPSDTCTESTATDLGGPGNNVTVPVNGCVRVRDAYPSWWSTLDMAFENTTSGSYPVPFTWTNTCSGSSGSGTFAADFQRFVLHTVSKQCATLIDLKGTGTGNITIRYWGT